MRRTDFYLRFKNFYDRLEDDYKNHGKLIIAYDFDDTISNFSKYKFKKAEGYKNDKLIKLLQDYKDHGYFILFTARSSEETIAEAVNYIKEHNIPLDIINENKPELVWGSLKSKPYYNVLLDDRSGLYWPYKALKKLLKKIKRGDI